MAFDLSSIVRNQAKPPRLCIYGVPGIGKSTFASDAPNPIFLPIEDGLGQIDVPAFPQPKTFDDVLEAIDSLNGEHDYSTLVLDSLDSLEPLVWKHVCDGHDKESIEEFGYGKGYVFAMNTWRRLLGAIDDLRDNGMATVLIAHSAVVRTELPDVETFDRYQMRIHKYAEAAVSDWCDAILFANYEVKTVTKKGSGDDEKRKKRRGVGQGRRQLHTQERPAWRAKNRYGMPADLELSWAAVEPYLMPDDSASTPTPIAQEAN